jgi:hypothetical protein
MQGTECAIEAFDLDRLGIDQQRLGFTQSQRVRALLTDSVHYLGLALAGGEGPQQECRAAAALASPEARSSAGVGGC